jgi:acyl-coenzyme A synthetase/AMP-(fatty) acid ligase
MNLIDHLLFRAHLNPDDTGVVSGGRILSFGELALRVRGAATQLRRQGIEPGQQVAIYANDPVVHWVLVLAVMHEGAISCSAHPSFDPMPATYRVDAYLAERMAPFMNRTPVILTDAAWFEACARPDPTLKPQAFASADAVFRVISSSGTTGEPKAIPMSSRQLTERIAHANTLPQFGPSLCMMTPSTLGGFSQPLASIMRGMTQVFAFAPAAVERSIELTGVTNLLASPAQLQALVTHLEGRSTSLRSLRALTFGGAPLPASLLARLRQRIFPDLRGIYGSTEAGLVSVASTRMLERHPGCAGVLVPGASVELVDEDDQAVAPGEDGIVRVRSPGMCDHYVGDPQGTAQAFRDGWFYPGDRARFTPEGILLITGRATELVNLGGSKMNPVLIDDFLNAQPGIVDAAAFGVETGPGQHQIWAAVVVDREIDTARLIEASRERFGAKGPARLVSVASIARNAMGKIQREEVRAAVLAMLQAGTRH